MVEDKRLLLEKKRELEAEENKLFSIEEKWISNKITHDTYERWFSTINSNRVALRASIEHLNGNQDQTYHILQKNWTSCLTWNWCLLTPVPLKSKSW